MKQCVLFFSFLFALISLTGCSENKEVSLPDVGIPIDELNRDLHIELLPWLNTFKIGESVNLEIYLKSDIEVRATDDFNARMFVLSSDKSEWQEVQQIPDLGIFDPYEIVLSRREGGFESAGVSVYPKIPNQGKRVTLLIFITGNVYEDGQDTGQATSAYTIVILKP